MKPSDVRKAVYGLLKSIGPPVKAARPEGDVSSLPLITYAQITSVDGGKWNGTTDYQIDIWANTFANAVGLVDSVDDKLTAAGWRRTYESPDTNAREGPDLYHKALNYRAELDGVFDRILHY